MLNQQKLAYPRASVGYNSSLPSALQQVIKDYLLRSHVPLNSRLRIADNALPGIALVPLGL
jgi:hypothetical protein